MNHCDETDTDRFRETTAPGIETLARGLLSESEANVELPPTAARQAQKLAAALNQIKSRARKTSVLTPKTQRRKSAR